MINGYDTDQYTYDDPILGDLLDCTGIPNGGRCLAQLQAIKSELWTRPIRGCPTFAISPGCRSDAHDRRARKTRKGARPPAAWDPRSKLPVTLTGVSLGPIADSQLPCLQFQRRKLRTSFNKTRLRRLRRIHNAFFAGGAVLVEAAVPAAMFDFSGDTLPLR